ncbi:hypothetical protein RRSWK_05901 [Rhodopirellula sp. SWK7]|nr:hypothetical protein RRSWK_05901 [Rhodopirellula sp. SWK7]
MHAPHHQMLRPPGAPVARSRTRQSASITNEATARLTKRFSLYVEAKATA